MPSKDKRYKDQVGKTVIVPIVGRKIKIIKDNYADPEQGTGALKITPAHDFNDYEVGQRNKLDIINIFTEEGKINYNGPQDYIGLDRFETYIIIWSIIIYFSLFSEDINNFKFISLTNFIVIKIMRRSYF